jgi:hypothetical protein
MLTWGGWGPTRRCCPCVLCSQVIVEKAEKSDIPDIDKKK